MPHARLTALTRTPRGRLVARLDDRPDDVPDVSVARCFPWSHPCAFLSLRDAKGKEITLLDSLDDAPPDARPLIEEELRHMALRPRILRVLDHKNQFDVLSFSVETDRGPVSFQLAGRDDIRLLSPTRALLRDADGVTYEIPDFNRLDPVSRRYLIDYF